MQAAATSIPATPLN